MAAMADSQQELMRIMINENTGFIGGGNIAKAICEGIVDRGLIKYSQIFVSCPHAENLSWWKDKGANAYTENGKVIEGADHYVYLTVKPNCFRSAISNINATVSVPIKPKVFVSVMSGIQLEKVENELHALGKSVRVIRAMPNPALVVGTGYTVLCAGTRAQLYDAVPVKDMFRVFGICREVPESMFSAVGSLTVSGLAFIYLIIEALADAAVKQGIPKVMAISIAAQTTLGAAKMAMDTKKHTAILRDEVCSFRGSTIAGISVLELAGVRATLFKAVEAATLSSEDFGFEEDS